MKPGTLDAMRTQGFSEDNHNETQMSIPDSRSLVRFAASGKGGYEFVLVDAETLAKKPAFDHEKLAAALSKALPPGEEAITALGLPFNEITFVDGERAIEVNAREARWRCDLTSYACRKSEAPGSGRFGGGVGRGVGPLGTLTGIPGPRYNFPQNADARVSPDGKWEAWVNNFNVWVRPKGKQDGVALSYDGSEGNYYAMASLAWSNDSKMIVAYRVRPGYERKLDYVESSPANQLQPKYHTIEYAKPGDALDQPQPVLFNIETKKQIVVDNTLFPNPYNMTRLEWRKDSRAFTFEYNQRGHQVYRVIEVEAATGKARALISEEAKTFFSYRPLQANQRESGSKYRYDVNDGREIVWMSERDGWRHLYLYDSATGKVKNQITKGDWVVRGVEKVDEEKRQIWLQASGMYPGKDPYFIHYYRINFDGTGLTALTEADGDHTVVFSPDRKYYVDMWSRVDLAPISELRSTEDRKLLLELEKGDISA